MWVILPPEAGLGIITAIGHAAAFLTVATVTLTTVPEKRYYLQILQPSLIDLANGKKSLEQGS